jgi:NTE family protein
MGRVGLQPMRHGAGAGVLLALFAATAPTAAQTVAEAADRPRIGLALSGGGARGAAHIGVLKVLDELRVPVHCVAGTSMGAVVGGAFAAGNSPAAMQQLIEQTDWSDVFSDAPPRGELSVRRKAEDYKGLFAPEFGVRDGRVLLPSGLVAGITIESFLRRLASPAQGIDEFARLPIPFRAVAADLETGQEVVLERGSLAQAMRASMAIPGAIAPVDRDGRLLVDGGIANNLPIDVARAACDAQVVIAVNIATPAMKRADITSALGVVGQLVNLLGKERVDRQLAGLGGRDIVIAPELGDISAASFERQLDAIAIGERTARAHAAALQRYSLPADDYAQWRSAQLARPQPPGRVDAVRFEGIARTNPEVLAGLLQTRPGSEANEAQLAADLRRIYGRGDFEAVDYHIEQGPAGRTLVLPLREKSTGPDYLRFGVGLASDFRDEATFDALFSYRRTWLNRAGGEWVAEAQVGRSTYLFSEFYQPLERAGRVFVAPYARIGQTRVGVYAGDDRIADYRLREGRLGADVGLVLGNWGEARAGVLVRDVRADVSTGPPILPSLDVRTGGIKLQFFADTHDAPWFPRSGQRAIVGAFFSTHTSGGQARYRRLEALWSAALSGGEHTVALTLAGGSGLGSPLPAYEGFTLGGPFRLSGYRIGQLSGERYGLATLRYYNRQVKLPTLLGAGAYIGGSLEAGRVDRRFSEVGSTGTLASASLYVAAETFLGPAFFGIGVAPGRRHSVYLLVGAP